MLMVAVFIFLRLRAALGRRTGSENPPAEFGPARREKAESRREKANENVVTLPGRTATRRDAEAAASFPAIDSYAKPGTELNAQLTALARLDPSFDPKEFVNGGRMAYEMIVTAFADGDRKALRNLLSREVYDGFSNAIGEREKRGEHVKAQFVGIDDATIKSAELVRGEMHVTTRFVSQIISATYDTAGAVVDGDPEQVAEVIDLWTFARDPKSRDPNWKLVATESES